MVIVLKKSITDAQIQAIRQRIDCDVRITEYNGRKIALCDAGAKDQLDETVGVEAVFDENPSYRYTDAEFHIGNGNFTIIAGPCSVESEEQIMRIAADIKAAGANMLRAGAFKPRTSPYSFQGLGCDGLKLLVEAGKKAGLPTVSEITEISQIDLFGDIDVIQVGARNMQNYELLKELGHSKKTVLLKRGQACTLKELLLSAEYILAGGNNHIILCERGIRTFETVVRNTFDVAAIPMLHEMTGLPVIADPSHATGKASLIQPVALAATVAGADGLMIEVHDKPEAAFSDGGQALTPKQFVKLKKAVDAVSPYRYHLGE